jgi:hypothetical protein
MYIQEYFKNGKLKKGVKPFKNVDSLVSLLIEMNGSKTFLDADNNFKKRDLIMDNGVKINMWDAMVERGCNAP